MLSLMWAAPLSAAELARELEISQALASHHLRQLVSVGLAELASTRSRRGGLERRFRTVHGTPLSDRSEGTALLAEALVHNLRERAARRAEGGASVTSDAELWLEPDAWEDIRHRMAELLADLHEASRPPHEPGTVRIAGTVMLFPLRER